MDKDYVIKDKILHSLTNFKTEYSFCTKQSIAAYCNISIERANALLEEIYNDHRCTREKGTGYEHSKYTPNPDTKPFLESGGYSKLARVEKLKNFPKDKWYLLDIVKILVGAAIGIFSTLLLQEINSTKKSKENTLPQSKTIDTLDKGKNQVHLKETLIDSSKK